MTANSERVYLENGMDFDGDATGAGVLGKRDPVDVPPTDRKVAYERELIDGYTEWACNPLLDDGWFIAYSSPHWLVCDERGHAVTSVAGTPDDTEISFNVGGTAFAASRIRIRPTAGQEAGWDAKYEKPLDGIPGSDIALSAITSGLLADGAVTEDKITEGAVTSGKISDGAVTTDKVEDLGITTAKLANGAVTGDKVESGAVTTDKLANDAVTPDKLVKFTKWEFVPPRFNNNPIKMRELTENGWQPYTDGDGDIGAPQGDASSARLKWNLDTFSFAAIRFKVIPNKTSDLLNTGADGEHPFITIDEAMAGAGVTLSADPDPGEYEAVYTIGQGGVAIGNINIPKNSGFLSGFMTPVTWQGLKNLKEELQLVPGMQYRITDYVATTNGDAYSRSANHPFDIIVVADSTSKLNEKVRVIQHDGDIYFNNCKLEAWEVWYCLDNDTNRFAWADAANGKGVIYRLIDEWHNDVPYDFKGIQFKAYDDTDDVWRYTFDSGDASSNADLSLHGGTYGDVQNWVFGNKVSPCYVDAKGLELNRIVFKGENCYFNTFGNNCNSNTFGNYCHSNTFGTNCVSNTFGTNYVSNTLGNNYSFNTFGDSCYFNTFGNNCYSNTFGNDYSSNTFGKYCFSNIFGDDCYSNIFGNNCNSNIFGNNCSSNTFSNGCQTIILGHRFNHNTFGSGCQNIRFVDGNDGVASDVANVAIESGNINIVMKLTSSNRTESAPYRNVIVRSGINNSTTELCIEDPNDGGQTFNTIHKPRDSYEISW